MDIKIVDVEVSCQLMGQVPQFLSTKLKGSSPPGQYTTSDSDIMNSTFLLVVSPQSLIGSSRPHPSSIR